MEIITNEPLQKLRKSTISRILDNAHHLIYHNVDFAHRILKNLNRIYEVETLSEREVISLQSSVWLYTSLFYHKNNTKLTSRESIAEHYHIFVDNTFPLKLKMLGYNEADSLEIIALVKCPFKPSGNNNNLQAIFKDMLIMDFVGNATRDRIKQFYKEAVLNDVKMGQQKFYNLLIGFFLEYEPKTKFAEIEVAPYVPVVIAAIEKEQKRHAQKKNIILKKELDIDESELKQLRKNLTTVKGRDARGIQTLFRTTSHNHYTLNEMVDRKANIMITVNSIILSILIGGLVNNFVTLKNPSFWISSLFMSIASFLSIVFAVIAITPNKTQGRFTIDDIKNKNGNLLYFGNFHNMSFKDYEWGMLAKLNDSNFLYSSMIKDLYFLGKTLDRKYRFIRLSLTIFLAGLVLSFLISLIHRIWI